MIKSKHTDADPKALLPYALAARRLSLSIRSLKALVAAEMIPFIRVSPGRVAFDPDDLRRYIDANRVG